VKILLANDDGYRAEGLRFLREALEGVAPLTVVAPDRNQSGSSHSLTLEVPLRVQRVDADTWYVINGTPTDCVHLAITGLFDFEFDMVVSGVNDGANLGDDVLYSGTVAAAIEGRFLGLPTVAVSLVPARGSGPHYATAARVARELVLRLVANPLHHSMILNVNVPDLPYDSLRGFEVTRLGHRHRAEAAVRGTDPRGREIFWIGAAGEGEDAGPGTDFHAVAHGFVSVTPLQVDLTRHSALEDVRAWLREPAP
jgi:5'-nucleotidase